MTPQKLAEVLNRRGIVKVSDRLLVSLATALAVEPHRVCWRALQELVAGDRPGTPPELLAKKLNVWGEGGDDFWWPQSFHMTGPDIQALANAFASERECWSVFCAVVEEAISELSEFHREIAEEN
jgi:hypothetical protein